MKERKKIELHEFTKDSQGYLKWKKGRLIKDIVQDLTKSLDDAKISYEYVSAFGALGSLDVAKSAMEWPRGNTYALLRTGANEGYSIEIIVECATICALKMAVGGLPEKGMAVFCPLRIKLLCTREEALKAYDHVWFVMED